MKKKIFLFFWLFVFDYNVYSYILKNTIQFVFKKYSN